MNAAETAYVESLETKVTQLEEQLDWFRRHVFGPRSEKIVRDLDSSQLFIKGLEPRQEPVEKAQQVTTHQRKTRRTGADKISLPDSLPVEEVLIDLPEEEKVAPNGKPLGKIGEEVSHKLVQKSGSFYIKRIIRPKYALPNGEGVAIAELPDSILPKCRADESLLAEIVVSKFADHLPLYRISEVFARQEIGISRQLLSQWVLGLGKACEPLYKEMRQAVLSSETLFIDETPISLQEKGRGKVATAYMWVMVGGPYRIYDFHQSRSHSHVEELLKDYHGFLHSDKYGAYVKQATKEQITWCPCWAHIRRKFFEAQSGDRDLRKIVLERIGDLFELERQVGEKPPDQQLLLRQESQIPIIDELIDTVKGRLVHGKLLPKSGLRKACGYFCSLIPYLRNYIDHPDARLDNNTAERAIRPLAIGRKNWLFVGSVRGGKAAAGLLSLVQTCRNLGINPREYLEDVFRRLPGHSALKVAELLPDQWAAARA